ncbi:MAG: hypothetical protein ACYC1Q_01455 [Bacteroidia bacterium]
MKRNLLIIAGALLSIAVQAQPLLKNSSFENWNNVGGFNYLNDWDQDSSDIQNTYVSRTTTASNGTYGLKIGTDPNVGLSGVYVEIFDSLTEIPGSLTFDYMVKNNNSQFANGAYVQIYFYDSTESYLFDIDWQSPSLTNNSTFQKGTIPMGFSSKPAYFDLYIAYNNALGGSDEYVIFDNFQFTKHIPAGIDEDMTKDEIHVFPNPASTYFMLSVGQVPKSVDLVAMNGSSVEVQSDAYGRFGIEALQAGVYIVKWTDSDSGTPQITKLVVTK